MERVTFSFALFHPRYWLVWLGFALWFVCMQLLPFRVLQSIGAKLGHLAARLSDRRRIIARKNIALCFPELSEKEQDALFWKTMASVGQGLVDSGVAWFWPKWRMDRVIDVEGVEHLQAALASGQGILFFSYHFTSLEIALAEVNRQYPEENYGFYRPHANKVYEYVMRKGRERHAPKSKAVPRKEVRTIMRALRNGRVVLYIPDQDYGRQFSTFVPFMGVDAATVTAPTQLAKTGRAKVLSFCAFRKPDGSGYLFKIYPEFEGYGEDENADALQMNQFLEGLVREYPEQYLWVHRRFKSRPDQQTDFYELNGLKSMQRRHRRRRKQDEKRQKAQEKSKS